MNLKALGQARFVPNQSSELRPQGFGEDFRERREQHARVRIGSREEGSSMRATMVFPVPAEPDTRAGPA